MSQTFLLVIILLFSVYFLNTTFEGFMAPYLQFGTKRLMSYDLRGDPYIPYVSVSPWNQVTNFPIRNREIYMG